MVAECVELDAASHIRKKSQKGEVSLWGQNRERETTKLYHKGLLEGGQTIWGTEES